MNTCVCAASFYNAKTPIKCKTIVTHNNFRHCRVHFYTIIFLVRQPFPKNHGIMAHTMMAQPMGTLEWSNDPGLILYNYLEKILNPFGHFVGTFHGILRLHVRQRLESKEIQFQAIVHVSAIYWGKRSSEAVIEEQQETPECIWILMWQA